MTQKGVSFIICTYNGKDRILPAIENIFNQNSDNPFELIVVDNNSDEDHFLFYQELQKKYTFKLIVEKKQGLIYARNTGILVSKYEYITFIDDDNYIIGNWVDKVVKIFDQNPEVGIIGSKNNYLITTDIPEWFFKYKECYAVGEQWHKNGIIDFSKRSYVWGAGMSIRKKLWLDAIHELSDNIFMLTGRTSNTLTSGDEHIFCRYVYQKNYKLFYSSEIELNHLITPNRLSIDYLFNLNYFFGKSQKALRKKEDVYTLIKNYLKLCWLRVYLLTKKPRKHLDCFVYYHYLKGYLEN